MPVRRWTYPLKVAGGITACLSIVALGLVRVVCFVALHCVDFWSVAGDRRMVWRWTLVVLALECGGGGAGGGESERVVCLVRSELVAAT